MKEKIKKGDKFVCIKDYVMEDGVIEFSKGVEYLSEKDGCLTDDHGDPDHQMNLEINFFDFFTHTDKFKIENLERRIELLENKLEVAEKALHDIEQWDDDLDDEWGDPGRRASIALQKNLITDGF